MSDKIFAEPFVTLGGKQKYTVLVSIVAHTLIIATAIIVPVVATDSLVLPSPFTMITFRDVPLPPSPPPPPRGRATERPAVAKFTTPVIAPDGIIAEKPSPPMTEPIAESDVLGLVKGGDYFVQPAAPSPAAVPDQAPFREGGDIKRPLKIKDAAPAYPSMARAAHVEGIVIIEATIGVDGKVQDARILRSANPLLNDAALDAVRRWEYTPTLLNGIPVAIVMTVTVNFRLR